jgi:serine protease inhibitor
VIAAFRRRKIAKLVPGAAGLQVIFVKLLSKSVDFQLFAESDTRAFTGVDSSQTADTWIMRIRILVLVAALACGAVARPLDARDTKDDLQAFVTAQNQFALAMYWQMTRDQDQFVLSPFSMSSVLAMTLEGARGKTADEIERVIGLPRDRGARRAAYASVQPATRTVNAVFTQKDGTFKTSYGETLKRYYGVTRTEVDFPGAIWFAKRSVDTWIETATGKRIPREDDRSRARITRLEGPPDALAVDHIPAGGTRPSGGIVDIGPHPKVGVDMSRTSIILMFKNGATVAQVNRAMAAAGVEVVTGLPYLQMMIVGVEDDGTFGPLDRALESFDNDPAIDNASPSPVIEPDIMGLPPFSDSFGRIVLASASSASGTWTSDVKHEPRWESDILHRTSQDGMVVLTLLMSRTGTFPPADSDLTAANVARWHRLGSISSNLPIPDMPAFSVKTRAPLRTTFQIAGLEKLFQDSVEDLSSIDGKKPSPIQTAAHHAMFSLTAQGFEAAAATVAGSAVVDVEPHASGPAPPQAVVFILQDAKTGLILFMGRMR